MVSYYDMISLFNMIVLSYHLILSYDTMRSNDLECEMSEKKIKGRYSGRHTIYFIVAIRKVSH